jgi:hypothetical protein
VARPLKAIFQTHPDFCAVCEATRKAIAFELGTFHNHAELWGERRRELRVPFIPDFNARA